MKYLFLFMGLSLIALNEAKAVEYNCINPRTKQVLGKVKALENAGEEACRTTYCKTLPCVAKLVPPKKLF